MKMPNNNTYMLGIDIASATVKAVIKELRNAHPEANIIASDYGSGASEVNRLNRINLMPATANKPLRAEHKDGFPKR